MKALKIFRPSIAMANSLLFAAVCALAIPDQTANAFFHKRAIAECNDEDVHYALTEIVSERMEPRARRVVRNELESLFDSKFVKENPLASKDYYYWSRELRDKYNREKGEHSRYVNNLDLEPKYESVQYKRIRQESYDDENKRRICSAVVEFEFDTTTEIGEAYSQAHGTKPRYHLVYAIFGTSDGDHVSLDHIKKMR